MIGTFVFGFLLIHDNVRARLHDVSMNGQFLGIKMGIRSNNHWFCPWCESQGATENWLVRFFVLSLTDVSVAQTNRSRESFLSMNMVKWKMNDGAAVRWKQRKLSVLNSFYFYTFDTTLYHEIQRAPIGWEPMCHVMTRFVSWSLKSETDVRFKTSDCFPLSTLF